MKILTRREIEESKNEQLERGREIDQYIAKKTKELNEFNTQYEQKKREIHDDFIKFQSNIEEKKRKLAN